MSAFDDYKGDYEGLKKVLNESLYNMKKDYDTLNLKKWLSKLQAFQIKNNTHSFKKSN